MLELVSAIAGVCGVIVGILALPDVRRRLQRWRTGRQKRELVTPQISSPPKPSPDTLPDIDSALAMMRKATFETADATELAWIAQLEKRYYPSEAVPLETMQAWFSANPSGFFVICLGGDRVGHATLLPIREKSMSAMIEGDMSEKELKPADLYPPEELENVRCVYIESVIADSAALTEHLHRTLFVQFLLELRTLITCVARPRNLQRVYAYPATERGLLALTRLGFAPLPRSKESDKPVIYGVRYRELLRRIRALHGRP